jgi:two-component system, sensor histidine kinase PdtaS
MNLFIRLAIILASLPVLATAQRGADSLRLLLRQAQHGRNAADVLHCFADLSWHFVNTKQYDSVLHYGYSALNESKEITGGKVRASVLTNMGVAYSAMGLPDSSIHYYDNALALYSYAKDTINSVTIQSNLAIIYKNKGLFDKSLETSFNALSMLEQRPPDRVLASCYNTIGVVYEKTGDYEDALSFYYKSLAVRRQIGYARGIGQSYNNIGEVHMSLHHYDSALANFLRALEVKRASANAAEAASTLTNIGATLIDLARPAQAEPYLRESLELEKTAHDRTGMAITLNHLAEAKLLTGDLYAAENYLKEAEPVIKEAGALNELRKSLELKVWLYKQRKDYHQAFEHAEMLVAIKDSLLNSEKAEQLRDMQVRYETEKKEQQIVLLEERNRANQAEIKTKQLVIYGLLGAVFLVGIIGTQTYNRVRAEREHSRRVETLLRELNHRVKNNLQILSSIFTLQVQQQTDETILLAMKSGEGRVNAMALIHKKLYNDQGSLDIRIKEYIHELVQYLVHSYGFNNRSLRLSVHVEEIKLDVDKVIRIGLIVNELVSNAFKYAYANQDLPQLDVHIAHEAGQIQVEVRDNGAGLPEAFDVESAQSFGLRMIRTFVRELRGKLAVNNQGGARFMLNIPI